MNLQDAGTTIDRNNQVGGHKAQKFQSDIKLVLNLQKGLNVKMKKDSYSDIINLSHYVSKKRPRMSIEQRSAQFAPFSALTGYEEEIEEAGREFVKKMDEK